MNAVLHAEDLTIRFGGFTALDGLTLSVAAGEKLALLGHNGAGKSTFFRAVLGFLSPASGKVTVAGRMPGSSTARRAVSYLPESVAFHRALTGLEILTHFARLKGEPVAAVMPLLERVGVAHAARRPVGTWSKGMRQRLGLAQALLGTPSLLLLDEPTSGLDPVSRGEFYALIDTVAARGAAVVLSSHGLEEVESRTDRVAILSRGHLVAEGTLPELADRAALKAQIRVTARPDDADTLHARIGGTRINGASVELSCDVPGKFDLLRRLANEEGVHDIDLQLPGLDDVYRHYSHLEDRT
ncbi:ABC transporter ATP-binding protein [Frigidibacter sp. ROC022]|uniref:ABC transporter ATP-binding protein n=1 Tax=Frigidibacter sp. ROC022 TaxID=2971796 RepID=UPI00215A4590|nr:ABC transporter ATP-binding protein [Frigidibacter sp. ROC022]MCR8726119.1 ABC transporter ATP-binding protein [Frigidibacter sp. ROC022]